jgi:cobalt/nickel transport system permease protein
MILARRNMSVRHDMAGANGGVLWRVPAAIKMAVAVALVVGISLLPREHGAYLGLVAVLVAVLALLARVRWWRFIKRILMLEPFVLGVALLALFSPVRDGDGWGPRGLAFGFLLARCTLALAVMVLFTTTTPFAEMLRVFRQARVPALLVTTLALMHRYVAVLGDEAGRMRRARDSRTFVPGRRRAWWLGSTVIGQLFLRASERADRIYDAMCARGWRP